jgi:hypothetical protein
MRSDQCLECAAIDAIVQPPCSQPGFAAAAMPDRPSARPPRDQIAVRGGRNRRGPEALRQRWENPTMAENDDDQPIELNISLEKIHEIALAAREYDDIQFPDEADPGEESDEPDDAEELLDEGEDPAEFELREMIDDLNDDEVVDLIALTWVGRGDYSRAEWAEATALARERQEQKPSAYLMGIPALAGLIDEGLSAIGHPGIDAERD